MKTSDSDYAMYFFIAMYIMMAFDFVFNHIGFLIVMLVLMGIGSYFSMRWIMAKRKQENYSKLNPIMN